MRRTWGKSCATRAPPEEAACRLEAPPPLGPTPLAAPRLARATAVMAQISEPDVESAAEEIVRESSRVRPPHPDAMTRERAVHEQGSRAAVAVGAEPVERELHTVVRH